MNAIDNTLLIYILFVIFIGPGPLTNMGAPRLCQLIIFRYYSAGVKNNTKTLFFTVELD